MGRSRAVSQAAVDNHNQIRGKRKRTASGAEVAENSGTARKALAQEISEPKGAFYHCNYCNKDISGKIRIKCVVCPDFDLCIECLSVGAELTPHKCNHPYRVMDNLAFPLICPDWNVDEGDATARVVEAKWKDKRNCMLHAASDSDDGFFFFFQVTQKSDIISHRRMCLQVSSAGKIIETRGIGYQPQQQQTF